MSEEIMAAEKALTEAYAVLAKASREKSRNARHESEYGQAYQRLVRLGARQQHHRPKHRVYNFTVGH